MNNVTSKLVLFALANPITSLVFIASIWITTINRQINITNIGLTYALKIGSHI